MEQDQVRIDVSFGDKISRLFIFRMFYMFILIIPFFLIGIWIYLVMIAQFLYMLVLGRRHRSLWNQFVRFYTWLVRWQVYFAAMVNERPKFWW
ncbi:DUF4389 domain-containing protein [Candidatus Peregrinibacteria bacterium]|nr:DUF4389 domain-containing protein [Candidatus Peregrinibacteria bacterium]